MRLVSVYEVEQNVALRTLWRLLEERDPVANISHKEMPTFGEHVAFVAIRPYEAWYLIDDDAEGWVGSIYLTKEDEIGIALAKGFRGYGYGTEALKQLMALHPRKRYHANVAPANLQSQQFFLKHGFKPLQVTYELRP